MGDRIIANKIVESLKDIKEADTKGKSVKYEEHDAEKQYEIYKQTGKYPKPIIKAKWEIGNIGNEYIFIVKNGKEKKYLVKSGYDYVGKPVKTFIKSSNGAERLLESIKTFLDCDLNEAYVRKFVNYTWDNCKEVK